MIDRQAIERILKAAVHAPSGDNSQPWHFRVNQDSIDVFAHPERDHPLFNVDARGTYLAIGALVENITIAAQKENLQCGIDIFPDSEAAVRIRFSQAYLGEHPLHTAIPLRHTHRGPYDNQMPEVLAEELASFTEGNCSIRIVRDKESVSVVGDAVSVMEESALKTQKIHSLFFNSIVWKEEHNEKGAPGLYIKTTELPPPVQALFRLIRHWPIMRLFHFLGFPKIAARANASVYKQSGALAVILLDGTEARDFIDAGRCMQRVWLTVTAHQYAAQPLAGLIYLAEYVRRTDDPEIAVEVKEKIRRAQEAIQQAVGASGKTIAMILRIGRPLKPATARSKRRTPHII